MTILKLYRPEKIASHGMAWYLASPYSGSPLGKDFAYQVAVQATAALTKRGLIVFSPIVHSHALTEFSEPGTLGDKADDHQFWMNIDQDLFHRFDGLIVAAQPGWRTSKGVQMEIGWAQEADMAIYTLVALFDGAKSKAMLVHGLLPDGVEGVFKVEPGLMAYAAAEGA